MFAMGLILGGLVVLAALSALSSVRVQEGDVAVLTRFGRALRKPDGKLLVLHSGLHFKQPWDRVLRTSLKEQTLELDAEQDRTVMTNDGIVVRYHSVFRYTPLESGLEHFLFALARPVEHMVGTFTCVLRNEIANFRVPVREEERGLVRLANAERLIDQSLGAYALIRRERKSLHDRIFEFGQRIVGDRYGVRLDAIDVLNFEPPDELRDTLNMVVQTKTDVEAALFRAEGECQQRVLAAEKGVEIARNRAKAIETEMVELGDKLSELSRQKVLGDYVARRKTEVLSESRNVYVRGTADRVVTGRTKEVAR